MENCRWSPVGCILNEMVLVREHDESTIDASTIRRESIVHQFRVKFAVNNNLRLKSTKRRYRIRLIYPIVFPPLNDQLWDGPLMHIVYRVESGPKSVNPAILHDR
jgi:hypothetical protein